MKTAKVKNIIWIGGSARDIELLLNLKKKGIFVFLVDKDTKCPGRLVTDKFLNSDAQNTEEIVKWLSSFSFKADYTLCLSSAEHATKTVAAINEKFNLPGIKNNSAEISFNKVASKKVWDTSGTLTPRWFKATVLKQKPANILSEFTFPVVLKKTESWGGDGVKLINTKTNLFKLINERKTEELFVEEHISGPTYQVVGVLKDERYISIGIIEKRLSDQFGTSSVRIIKKRSHLSDTFFSFAHKAAIDIGLTDGPVSADVIYNDAKLYMLEITALLPGDLTRTHLKAAGINIEEVLFANNQAFSLKTTEFSAPYLFALKIFVCDSNLDDHTRFVVRAKGVEDVKKMSSVRAIKVYENGWKITNANKSKRDIGFVVISAENFKDAHSVIDFVKANLTVQLNNDEFRNIILGNSQVKPHLQNLTSNS